MAPGCHGHGDHTSAATPEMAALGPLNKWWGGWGGERHKFCLCPWAHNSQTHQSPNHSCPDPTTQACSPPHWTTHFWPHPKAMGGPQNLLAGPPLGSGVQGQCGECLLLCQGPHQRGGFWFFGFFCFLLLTRPQDNISCQRQSLKVREEAVRQWFSKASATPTCSVDKPGCVNKALG